MPVVYNKYKMTSDQIGVYIGRGSPYGNKFIIGPDGDRDAVCDKYAAWIKEPEQAPLRQQMKDNLKGQNLICFCKQPFKFVHCHGDSIIEISNKD